MREYPVHLTIPVRGSITDGLMELIQRGEAAQKSVISKLTRAERLMNRKLIQRSELSPHEAFGDNKERALSETYFRMKNALDQQLTDTPCASCDHCVENFEQHQLPHAMTVGTIMRRECARTHTPERVCPDGFFPERYTWMHTSLPSEYEISSKYGIKGEKELTLTLFRNEVESHESMPPPTFGGSITSFSSVRRSPDDFPKGDGPAGDYGRQFDPEYLDENEVRMLRTEVAAIVSADEQRKKEMATPQTPTEDVW